MAAPLPVSATSLQYKVQLQNGNKRVTLNNDVAGKICKFLEDNGVNFDFGSQIQAKLTNQIVYVKEDQSFVTTTLNIGKKTAKTLGGSNLENIHLVFSQVTGSKIKKKKLQPESPAEPVEEKKSVGSPSTHAPRVKKGQLSFESEDNNEDAEEQVENAPIFGNHHQVFDENILTENDFADSSGTKGSGPLSSSSSEGGDDPEKVKYANSGAGESEGESPDELDNKQSPSLQSHRSESAVVNSNNNNNNNNSSSSSSTPPPTAQSGGAKNKNSTPASSSSWKQWVKGFIVLGMITAAFSYRDRIWSFFKSLFGAGRTRV